MQALDDEVSKQLHYIRADVKQAITVANSKLRADMEAAAQARQQEDAAQLKAQLKGESGSCQGCMRLAAFLCPASLPCISKHAHAFQSAEGTQQWCALVQQSCLHRRGQFNHEGHLLVLPLQASCQSWTPWWPAVSAP